MPREPQLSQNCRTPAADVDKCQVAEPYNYEDKFGIRQKKRQRDTNRMQPTTYRLLFARREGRSAKHCFAEQGTASSSCRVVKGLQSLKKFCEFFFGMASSDSATLDTTQPLQSLTPLQDGEENIHAAPGICYTTQYMPERLQQFRFDAQFGPTNPLDVTPAKFTELRFPARRQEQPTQLGRFLRQVREEVQVISPQTAAQYLVEKVFTPFELFDQEETWVLLLNTKNRITHEAMVYRGTVNNVVIRPLEIFKPAAQTNATAIVMAHNHPSGSPDPSPEDVAVTRSIVQAGQILGVEVLDHIVVGKDRWVSLKNMGLGFE